MEQPRNEVRERTHERRQRLESASITVRRAPATLTPSRTFALCPRSEHTPDLTLHRVRVEPDLDAVERPLPLKLQQLRDLTLHVVPATQCARLVDEVRVLHFDRQPGDDAEGAKRSH